MCIYLVLIYLSDLLFFFLSILYLSIYHSNNWFIFILHLTTKFSQALSKICLHVVIKTKHISLVLEHKHIFIQSINHSNSRSDINVSYFFNQSVLIITNLGNSIQAIFLRTIVSSRYQIFEFKISKI